MITTTTDWLSILPALWLVIGGLAVVAIDLRKRGADDPPSPAGDFLSYGAVAGALGTVLVRLVGADGRSPVEGFAGAVRLDDLSLFLSVAILAAAALMILLASDHVPARGVRLGEVNGLVLLAAAGMVLLVESQDLITFFVALEILSLAVYVLSGLFRKDPRSNEAAVKYFVTGAFASGVLLYGMALLYGATGSLNLVGISRALEGTSPAPVSLPAVGLALLAVGLAFKVGAVPFHMWVADVYEGAPTPVTAFMSVAVKAAGFGAFLRVLLMVGGPMQATWGGLIAGLAIATMVVGNLLAVWQRNVKRMLAYSSVAHTGYVLAGVAAMARGDVSRDAGAAAVFYLFAYTFMTLGAFAFLIYAGRDGRDAEDLEDFAGLARRRPWAAAAMTVFMVSLGGLPPTSGFFGKFLLFRAAVTSELYVLVVVGVLTSAVSLYYYLRVVVYMFMHPEAGPAEERPSLNAAFVVGFSAICTLLLGLVPSKFLALSQFSISQLLR
jgi:NADH-quinone oxidoreductase subunit N